MRSNRAPDPALDFASWILFEDPQLLAVGKPAGVLSQGGEGGEGRNLVDLARAYLGVASGVGVLHRLDRNVSGVVLLAKDPRAASKLTQAFAKGEVERVYEAVSLVRRAPAEPSFIVDAWLRKDETRNQVEARDARSLERLSPAIRKEFRESRTDVRVLSRHAPKLGPIARCEVRPITGRSHQIRVHLAFVGLPIVGDPKYGVASRTVSRPLLHSTKLSFRHPKTSKPIEVLCPLPWDDSLLESLS
ncbi:MAG: RluA family pseudouridine synthase [Myxococcales bacterium]|nr:RluA family pseudouridine synthase [Myxococcales bacterium]